MDDEIFADENSGIDQGLHYDGFNYSSKDLEKLQ